MYDDLHQYKADTSQFLRELGVSIKKLNSKQRDILDTASRLGSITKAEAQEKLGRDLVEFSNELAKLTDNAIELGRRQNLLARKDNNGSS
jgi:hypothetical protein